MGTQQKVVKQCGSGLEQYLLIKGFEKQMAWISIYSYPHSHTLALVHKAKHLISITQFKSQA